MSDPTSGQQPKTSPASASEATIAMAPGSGSGQAGSGAPGTLGLPGGAATTGRHFTSVPPQDLTGDKLILSAPRQHHDGKMVPSLGGIPLLAKLGQGGMGAVYYGIHPRLSKEVAVKVLPFHMVESQPGLVDRFFREAQIAARIESPHLVGVLDVNQENGLFYLVMEFVRGVSAGSYLKELRATGKMGLTEAEALDICIGGTVGLSVAHSERIVHRDIKPDNIMIPRARGGTALLFANSKLADLGLARSDEGTQSLTGTQACLGTPGYMSPEQCLDAKNCGTASDIFSMGATLYALLCGEPPFHGTALMKVLLATANEPHRNVKELRPDVTDGTVALINKCMAKNAADRFADAETLLAYLKMCRTTVSSSAGSSPAFTPTIVSASPSGRPISALQPVSAPQSRMPTSTIAGTVSALPQSQQPTVATAAPKKSSAGMLVAAGLVLALGAGGFFFWNQKQQAFQTELLTMRTQTSAAEEATGAALDGAIAKADQFSLANASNTSPEMAAIRSSLDALKARKKALDEREVTVSEGLKAASAALPDKPEIAQDKLNVIQTVGAEDRARNYPDLLAPIRNQIEDLKRKTSDVRFSAVRTELIDKHSVAMKGSGPALTVAVDELEKFRIQNAFRNPEDLQPIDALLTKLRARREAVQQREAQFRQLLTDSLVLAPTNPAEALKKLDEAEVLGRGNDTDAMPDLLVGALPPIEQRRKDITTALAQRAEADFAREVARAKDALQRGEYESGRVSLEAALNGLGDREHPQKTEAATLLAEARKETKRREDQSMKIREGDAYLKASEYEKAQKAYGDALEAWPQSPDRARIELGMKTASYRSLYARGDDLRAKGDLAGARKVFEECRKLWPDAPDAAVVEQAMRDCDAQMGAQQWDSLVQTGKKQLDKKQWATAAVTFEEALRLKPNDAATQKLLAEAKTGAQQEKYAAAMELGEKALSARSYDEAEKHFKVALEAKPNDKRAMEQMAKSDAIRRGEERYTDAMNRGNEALAGGRYPEAENNFRQALQARPDDPEATKGMADARVGLQYSESIREGQQALNARRWDAAQKAYERALKARPGDEVAKDGIKSAKTGERNEMIKRGLGGIGIRGIGN